MPRLQTSGLLKGEGTNRPPRLVVICRQPQDVDTPRRGCKGLGRALLGTESLWPLLPRLSALRGVNIDNVSNLVFGNVFQICQKSL